MRRSFAGTCVGVLLLLAGCGGSSSSDTTAKFKSGFQPAINQIAATAKAIGREIEAAPKQTDAQVGASFHALATQWQNALSRLQTLKPPASMAAEFNTLTGAANRVESDLNAAVAAAETHSGTAAEQAGASVVNDVLAAKAAATTLTNKLGIK